MQFLRRIPPLASVWLAVALVVLLVVQFVPLMAISMPALAATGIMVHLLLLAVFVEAAIGRIPRPLLLLPLLVYGTYYAVAVTDRTVVVPRRDAQLQASNSLRVPFDPVSETLHLTASGIDEQEMIARYDLVMILAGKAPLSVVETAMPEECAGEFVPGNPQWSRVAVDGVIYCVKRTFLEEMPAQQVLKVEMPLTRVVTGAVPEYVERYSFVREGAEVGVFERSNIAVLSWFPGFAIGCGLIDGAFLPGRCGVSFMRDTIAIDGTETSAARRQQGVLQTELDQERIAAILGLVPRGAEELAALAIR